MKYLHKIMFFFIIAFLFAIPCFSLEVSKTELESASNGIIEFINYAGPHDVVNTRQEIQAIGTSIAQQLLDNQSTGGTYGSDVKYQIIHAIDPSTKTGLDADILILGTDAGVDHIRNLRWIISSYLLQAYNYSQEDADTLATFITVYNAVYRNDMNAFSTKYKQIVVSNLTQEKAGLSIDYRDWPGNTQIVIPLYDPNGGISAIDTSIISDKTVVESMQDEDGKNIDVRKDMVDLKEREADKASQDAIEAQKQAVEAQKKALEAQEKALEAQKQADAERQKLKEDEQDAIKAAEDAQKAKEEAAQNPNDQVAKEKATEAEKTAQEKNEQVEKQAEIVKQAENTAATQTQTATEKKAESQTAGEIATEKQQLADKKLAESQTERTEIAKDQKTVITEAAKEATVISTYGLKLIDEKAQLSALVRIDATTGLVIKQSPVTVIRNRVIIDDGEQFIAVAGTDSGNKAIKLVTLDKKNMEIIVESAEKLSPTSVLVQDKASFLVTIQDGSNWKVARYNSMLTLTNMSDIYVNTSTPIIVTDKGIIVTSKDGNIKLLKTSDLTEVK